MKLKEVLEKATERPWEILRTGGPSETIMGDYVVGISSAHNESLVVDPTWFPDLPAIQRCVAEPILTVHGKFDAMLVAHAVNKLEGLLEAMQQISTVITHGSKGLLENQVAFVKRTACRAIRQAEEVSP